MSIWIKIRGWFSPKPAPPRDVGAWFEAGNHLCPDCGGTLLKGPEGGASFNALCSKCHAEFNIGPGPFSERLAEPGQGRAPLYGMSE